MVTIGMDLGARTGISIIYKDQIRTHETFFKPKKGEMEAAKYVHFLSHVGELLWLWTSPKFETRVYYEYVARHLGTKAAHAFGAYRMILLMACYEREIPCEILSVQAIKKAATEKGNAKKEVMIEAAKNRFNPPWELTDNEADSMWIAYLGRETTNESLETIEELPALKAVKGNGSVYNDIDRKRK